jgi:hypothetical protein
MRKKTKRIKIILSFFRLVLFCSCLLFFGCGEDSNSTNQNSDSKKVEEKKKNETLQAERDEALSRAKQYETERNEAQSLAKQYKTERDEAIANNERNILYTICISLGIVILVVATISVIIIRSPKHVVNGNESGVLRCPRCGWEYAPGDTICKNPNCKTHF